MSTTPTAKNYQSKTARMYQCGLSREDAETKGADLIEFDALELEFKGGSVPLRLLRGIPYVAPYSCEYHSGGAKGAALRAAIKEHNSK